MFKLTLFLFSLILTPLSYAQWVDAKDGIIPLNSFVSGAEADGEVLYLCRAKYKRGMHIGKIREGFIGCIIGWGGHEVAVKTYQTQVQWLSAKNGVVPENAMPAGFESNGEKLFACRAKYKDGVHTGKVRNALKACSLSYGGREVQVNPYEVLVK